MRSRWALALLLALFPALAGCDDDPESAPDLDAAADATADVDGAEVAEEPAVEVGDAGEDAEDVLAEADLPASEFEPIARTAPTAEDPNGHSNVTEALEAGEVRAGRVTSFDHGFEGVEVDCRPSDFKLYNAVAAFCIAGPTPINLWTYSGGQLIDADLVGEANERFFMLLPHNQIRPAGADEVVVLADGSEGTAVVAVRGPEETLRLITDLVGPVMPLRGASFETEYRLAPDVPWLEIVTWVRSPNRRQVLSIGDLVLFGNTLVPFTPGYGRDPAPDDAFVPAVVAGGHGRSYALFTPGDMSPISIDFEELGAGFPATGVVHGNGLVEAGGEGAVRRYLIVGGDGTLALREAMATIEGHEPQSQSLRVDALDGESRSGVSLVIEEDGIPRDWLVTGPNGTPVLPLPAGGYVVRAEGWPGGDAMASVDVPSGEAAEADLTLPAPARLVLNVTASETPDGPAAATPALVQIDGGVELRERSRDGAVDLLVPPGNHRLVVSRGEEYSAYVEDLAFTAGQTVERAVELTRRWSTPGLASGEFHQHSTRSVDSTVPELDRLMSNVVAGVDFVVPTDHDSVTHYAPIIVALDLGSLIFAMPASEVSPIAGHLNPMPMVFDPTMPAGGAIPLATRLDGAAVDIKTVPELIAELRADYGAEVIQINHPRDNSAFLESGNYNPLLGPDEADPNRFTTDFDQIEVMSRANHGDFCEGVTDWLSFVARGHRITGVGNSDTHSLNGPAGYPRNYLHVADDAPAALTQDAIISALLANHSHMSGGALITFPGGPAPGDELDVSEAATFVLPVLIQVPEWAVLDRFIVLMGPQIASDVALTTAPGEVVAYDDTLTLNAPSTDTYLVVVAWGATEMSIVTPGKAPVGFTNPIFLDADGDGQWTPPGVATEADLVRLDLPFCD